MEHVNGGVEEGGAAAAHVVVVVGVVVWAGKAEVTRACATNLTHS